MGLREGLNDRISAAVFNHYDGIVVVQVSDRARGYPAFIVETSLLTGKITVEYQSGTQAVVRGRNVSSISIP